MNASPLRGWIRWVRTDPTEPPGLQDDPGSLWAPAPGVVPSSGTFVHLESPAGDWIGRGGTYDYDLTDAQFRPTWGEHRLQLAIDGSEHWRFDLDAPFNVDVLGPGYLPELESSNPARGSLYFSGEGRGCNETTGWAVIDDLQLDGDELRAFTMRFEQSCGGGPPLHGYLRWLASDAPSSTSTNPSAVTAAGMPPTMASTLRDTSGAAIRTAPEPITTAAVPALYGPMLASTTPAARGVLSPSTSPSVTFGRTVYGISEDTVVLIDGVTGSLIPTSLSESNGQIMLNPANGLPAGTPLLIGIGGIYDSTGEYLPVTYIPFRTSGTPFPSPSIGGNVRVVPGDFDGTGSTDALLYQPGTASDLLIYGYWNGFGAAPTNVSGSYRPISGDFDGNGYDDILWYAPGTAADALWSGSSSGFRSKALSVAGTFSPIAGDFNGDGYDDILWYAPGTAADALWNGSITGFKGTSISVKGTFRPAVADFNGDGYDDVFWYGPGSAGDVLWNGRASGFTSKATSGSGSFVPIAGDFNGDGYGDITWYAAGTAQDYVWSGSSLGFGTRAVTIKGTYTPTAGDYNGDGYDDILFYGLGTAGDALLFGSPTGAAH
jgi:hypothetical protein